MERFSATNKKLDMELRFSDRDFNFLSQFEKGFSTAVFSGFCSTPGYINLNQIHQIWKSINPTIPKLNAGCSHCIMTLMKEVGTAWMEDKAERERQTQQLKAKEESRTITEPTAKKPKKTKK
jgi:phage FluMu protein Com